MSAPSENRDTGIPAFVTAGGRLSPPMAEATGTTIKALVPLGGETLLARVIGALRRTESIGRIIVIGPKAEIEKTARHAGADDVLQEGTTGPENLNIGLSAYRDFLGDRRIVFAASDLPYLHEDAVSGLLKRTSDDTTADIVFPVIHRADYEAQFPDSPNEWARLAGKEYTGGSVMLLRPAAIERNRAMIERVFAARKSQWDMARLLGLGFALKFKMGALTIPAAEERASQLTGCRCRALMESDPRLAADVDTIDDLQYAQKRFSALS
jgi:GTP:adenosylcobinamide-phosphate guanylyltransferase